MYSQALLLLAAGTAAAYRPHQLNGVRNLQQPGVQARQTGSIADCTSSAFAIISSVPTPNSDLANYFETFVVTADLANPTVFCEITSALPTSLSSAYFSYDEAASSWYSEQSSNIVELASNCAGEAVATSVTEIVSILESYTAGDCTGSLPPEASDLSTMIEGGALSSLVFPTADATVTDAPASPTNTEDEAGSEQTTSIEQGAAARPTGVVAGAIAAAGFIGAVAMM
ncbi:hypothetical protein DL766_005920 [Monosporascus sp. MC13-8B]|uniref:DUF7735 domain-containing protein n=1 Tax=Monosporascus cannonballus TaxID=155416 RepID=A0ABY0HA12_9PEZI|nr:hypothetical protein DL762_003588 [Monosporascus cannonballus]RYO93938.1 hypothetical protein DL763_004212 [Monosporascus cannonballus]RYP28329.1 hypothetical protein DL766_005920 [Monosporascus sp. MC13-8B]